MVESTYACTRPFACRTAAARHGRFTCDRGCSHADSASVGVHPRSTSGQPSATAPQLLTGASRSLQPALQRRGQRRRRRQGRLAAGARPRRERGPGPAAGEARPALVGGPRRRPGPAVSARRLQPHTRCQAPAGCLQLFMLFTMLSITLVLICCYGVVPLRHCVCYGFAQVLRI